MSYFVIFILVFLPGQEQPAVSERVEVMSASAPAVCQRRADELAREYLQKNADTLRRMQARVAGLCQKLGEAT